MRHARDRSAEQLKLLRTAIREIAAPMSGITSTVPPDRGQWHGFALSSRSNERTRAVDATKRAACVLIRRGGRILAVSRKDDPNAMGLPGGKVDPEDGPGGQLATLAAAAARELREETGLSIPPELLRFVFERAESDGFTTTTFEGEWADVRGPIRTAESGRVRWISWDELIDGPFGEYNRQLLSVIEPAR
jgi:8-oxo-dGTP pyrophosphatase MutT (NUDIX family)